MYVLTSFIEYLARSSEKQTSVATAAVQARKALISLFSADVFRL